VLAVNQHLVAAAQPLSNECDALVEVLMAGRLEVGRRQMEQIDADGPKLRFIVAIFLPQINDCLDAVPLTKLTSALDRKAAADRQALGDPMKIRTPFAAQGSIFFFNLCMIFFFIDEQRGRYCCFSLQLLLFQQSITEQQSFTTVPRPYEHSLPSRTDPPMSIAESRLRAVPRSDLRGRIDALAPWFHNINLDGVWTAPEHFLGDYPGAKFRRFEAGLPDIAGKSVLDIGCNAGFYSIEMKRRGAERVLGIDSDPRYLDQARLASETLGYGDIEFAKLDVYDVGAIGEKFDFVIFMGVLYHLRHPLLALDLIREHVAGDMMLFQSMQRGSSHVLKLEPDYEFAETDIFFETGFPKLHFIEKRYSDDWTNWWVPNRACSEAMLRSAGFGIDRQIEEEVYLCRVADRPYAKFGPATVYPCRGAPKESGA
jgi:tRNA (mo5U34)-methyltransferase